MAELDAATYRDVQRGIRNLDREAQKELNKALRTVARKVATTAKSNASWSSRIPNAIGVSVTTRRVAVKARAAKAPHARAYEGMSRGPRPKAKFRHPVFAKGSDRTAWRWVDQRTRPFIQPAAQQHERTFNQEAVDAIEDAARNLGWR